MDDVKHLLTTEALDINATDRNPENGKTALHWAVIKNHPACVELLLERNANKDIPDATRKKPLDYSPNLEISILLSVKKAELDLTQKQLLSEHMEKIVSYLNAHPAITSLNLSNNIIGPEGAKTLATLLYVTSLNLFMAACQDEGAKALASNSKFEELNLSWNDVGDFGAIAIANNKQLKKVTLENNHIGKLGAQALANNTTFAWLGLIGNCDIGEENAKILEEKYEKSTNFVQFRQSR